MSRHLETPSEKREGSPGNPSFPHSLTFSSPLFPSPFFLLSFLFYDLLLHSILSQWGDLGHRRGSYGLNCDVQFVIAFCFGYSHILYHLPHGIFIFFSSIIVPPPCHDAIIIASPASRYQDLHRWHHGDVPPFVVATSFLVPFWG